MSVLIKGMDMPTDCCQCKLARYDDYENETFCPFTNVMCLSIGRQDDCPLEEVTETHDKRTETHACDLISRQALCEYALNQKDKSVTPNDIMRFPSAELATNLQQTCNTHDTLDALDCISRQAAIDAIHDLYAIHGSEGSWIDQKDAFKALKNLPSAQPERLTDDDFETIRIHLNAYKEKLCNQQRWEEADEYQRIIDRFMAFASAQPDSTRNNDCNGCKYVGFYGTYFPCSNCTRKNKDYYKAERRENE